MKYFLIKQLKLIVGVLIFFLVFLVCYNKIVFSQKTKLSSLAVESISLNANAFQTEINFPVSLKIPSIKVDAAIEYVGLTADGAMDVPKNDQNVAWFNLGSLPGAEGSAVIAGHLDGETGQKAVFYNLKELKKGDEVFIEDNQKKIITFVVREIKIYDSEASVPEIFDSAQGQHLNLITCTGSWNKSQDEYMQRLVIFTDLKEL